MSNRLKSLAAVAVLCSTAACSSGSGLFSIFAPEEQALTDGAQSTLDTELLGEYLEVFEDLLEGDAVVQAETFQRVSAAALAQPSTTNRLKLALALGTPGHAGSNADHAQRELRELLAQSELLLPEERILASMLLAQIEQRLLLDLEAEQTQAAAIEEMGQRTGALEQRLRTLQDENQSLRRQLEQAQNIIDEITNIEQSIRERESAD
jgi:hypothetical protein